MTIQRDTLDSMLTAEAKITGFTINKALHNSDLVLRCMGEIVDQFPEHAQVAHIRAACRRHLEELGS